MLAGAYPKLEPISESSHVFLPVLKVTPDVAHRLNCASTALAATLFEAAASALGAYFPNLHAYGDDVESVVLGDTKLTRQLAASVHKTPSLWDETLARIIFAVVEAKEQQKVSASWLSIFSLLPLAARLLSFLYAIVYRGAHTSRPRVAPTQRRARCAPRLAYVYSLRTLVCVRTRARSASLRMLESRRESVVASIVHSFLIIYFTLISFYRFMFLVCSFIIVLVVIVDKYRFSLLMLNMRYLLFPFIASAFCTRAHLQTECVFSSICSANNNANKRVENVS